MGKAFASRAAWERLADAPEGRTMMWRDAVYLLSGVWGLAMVIVLISAIRLSYRIEARSEGLRNRSGLPRNAMWFHTILNLGVASDAETQALRRRMNLRFAIIVVGFALFCLALWSAGAFGRPTQNG